MVIALERYLIPTISKNQEASYHLALNRICTSLTKGWFRQFAIDNYPRLSNLDKDLLSIAHNIINNHPLLLAKKEPSKSLYEWILDPETRAIFEPIYPYTKILSFNDFEIDGDNSFIAERSGIKITSPVNNTSITAIITNVFSFISSCSGSGDWWASITIFPSEDFEESKLAIIGKDPR